MEIRVHCRTNLDLSHEEWPDYLPSVPNVGDYIQSSVEHVVRGVFQLELQVCRVSWRFSNIENQWIPHVELHMTDWQRLLPSKKEGAANGSIRAFYEWYAPLVGKDVSSFI